MVSGSLYGGADPARRMEVTFTAPPPDGFVEEAAALGVPTEPLDRLRRVAGAAWDSQD